MAAEDAIVRLLKPGDHVVLGDDVYGGTRRLFEKVMAPFGLEFTSIDMTSLDAIGDAIKDTTAMIWVETPTNPYLRIIDIAGVASLAKDTGAMMVVDNTFATPYLQRPLELGADIAVHSTTKYLGGHSDVVGGAAVTSDAGLAERLAFLQNAAGGVPGPFDSWLVLRGIKTLALRMAKHCSNAQAIAEFLESHSAVRAVHFPGLPSHPSHGLARKQMDGYGGMVSFELETEDAARGACSRTKLFFLAESLGGVESLIEHPASMTHASIKETPFAVAPELLRLSVGIEHPDDLIADLDAALAG
jgi:cystathionine gamma-synthase